VAKGKAAYCCEFKSQLGPLLMLCEDSKLTWKVRVEAVTRVINTGKKKTTYNGHNSLITDVGFLLKL
jgi:hypothetical protein